MDSGETLISSPEMDQAALFGVLHRIRDLGAELIFVQKCTDKNIRFGWMGNGKDCKSGGSCNNGDYKFITRNFTIGCLHSVYTYVCWQEALKVTRRETQCAIKINADYPFDHNRIGRLITKAWIAGGDIVRDMEPLFSKFGFEFTDEEIGGYGSVHLYLAKKI